MERDQSTAHTETGFQALANYATASHAVVLRVALRGFSKSVGQPSPQDMRSMLEEYIEFVSAIGRANGGDVFGLDSESVTIGFILREEAQANSRATAAVRAAKQLLDGFEKVSNRWCQRTEARVALSIGLHQGEVIAASPDSNPRHTPTVVGDAVNVADRLAQRARAGEAILSAPVREALRNQLPEFQIKPLGGMTFADRTRRVDIYCIPRAERLELGAIRHPSAQH